MVKMKKTFKYRIYANKETISKADNWLRLCCNLYNACLEERIYAWDKENPRNTSKTCSSCGSINKALKLSDRSWVCKVCGTLHDRDENASKNIKRLGQSHQELTYENIQCVS